MSEKKLGTKVTETSVQSTGNKSKITFNPQTPKYYQDPPMIFSQTFTSSGFDIERLKTADQVKKRAEYNRSRVNTQQGTRYHRTLDTTLDSTQHQPLSSKFKITSTNFAKSTRYDPWITDVKQDNP